MTVELKVFGGALFVKDKALKESPELKTLAIFVNAPNKTAAEAIIAGKVAEQYPANLSDYFKAKVWEHREELPCVEPGAFCTDFFETVAVWNASANEPAPAQPASDEKSEREENAAAEELIAVSKLDQHSRAACLALFGPKTEITKSQYNKVVDLVNIDNGSFQYQLAQAFVKEPRALALSAERQEEMLAWVRKTMLVSTLCPDIKKALTKWIDTPTDKHESISSDSAEKDKEALLSYNIALGIIARSMDFDITSTPRGIEQRAYDMLSDKNETRFDVWFLLLSRTLGVYDFHPAVIIAMIKTSGDEIQGYPGEIRKYIDKTIAALDCSKPDALILDIACGRTSTPMPQIIEATSNDETQPPLSGETLPPTGNPKSDAELNAEIDRAMAKQQVSEQLAADRGEFVPSISNPADPKWVDGSAQPKIENLGNGIFSVDSLAGDSNDTSPTLSEREQKIKGLIEEVLAGKSDCFDEEEAKILLESTGHELNHLAFMIMTDVYAMENGENPGIICDYDIQYLAWCAVEEWTDNPETRLDYLTKSLQDYREIEAAKQPKTAPSTPVIDTEPLNLKNTEATTTYRQQLILAALQGMCANPAYRGDFDDLPSMATMLADGVLSRETI